jgi:hypothetical protein
MPISSLKTSSAKMPLLFRVISKTVSMEVFYFLISLARRSNLHRRLLPTLLPLLRLDQKVTVDRFH